MDRTEAVPPSGPLEGRALSRPSGQDPMEGRAPSRPCGQDPLEGRAPSRPSGEDRTEAVPPAAVPPRGGGDAKGRKGPCAGASGEESSPVVPIRGVTDFRQRLFANDCLSMGQRGPSR
jgi:hypothetical protein